MNKGPEPTLSFQLGEDALIDGVGVSPEGGLLFFQAGAPLVPERVWT